MYKHPAADAAPKGCLFVVTEVNSGGAQKKGYDLIQFTLSIDENLFIVFAGRPREITMLAYAGEFGCDLSRSRLSGSVMISRKAMIGAM